MNKKMRGYGLLTVALVALGLSCGESAKAEDAECYLMASRVESAMVVDQSQSVSEQIVGVWSTSGDGIVMEFKADGTCQCDGGATKFIGWRVEGSKLYFKVNYNGVQFEMPWEIDKALLKRGILVLEHDTNVLQMTKKK